MQASSSRSSCTASANALSRVFGPKASGAWKWLGASRPFDEMQSLSPLQGFSAGGAVGGASANAKLSAAAASMLATARYLERVRWTTILLRATFEDEVRRGAQTCLQNLLAVEMGNAWAARWVSRDQDPDGDDGEPRVDLQPTLDLLLCSDTAAAQRARALRMLRAVFGRCATQTYVRSMAAKANAAWHARSAQWRLAGLLHARVATHVCALPALSGSTPYVVRSAFSIRRCSTDIVTEAAYAARSAAARMIIRPDSYTHLTLPTKRIV